jgi:hypothetical protein
VSRARVDDVVARYALFHLAGVAMALAEEITRGVSRTDEVDAGLYETKSFGGTHETVVVRVRSRRTQQRKRHSHCGATNRPYL